MAPGAVCGFRPQARARRELGLPGRHVGHSGAQTLALGNLYGGQYGTAPGPPLGRRYCFDLSNKNPLRGYPPSLVLYGMETDASLFPHLAFTARREAGRDLSRPFNRGEQDPATLALDTIGAKRVPVGGIQMCIWNEVLRRIDFALPFKGRSEIFHAYEHPPRRVADGATIHSWSYGTRLGSRATSQWSNLVEGFGATSLASGFAQDQLARVVANPSVLATSRIAAQCPYGREFGLVA